MKNVISCICNGVYASRLDQFNDPYEYEGIRYLDNYRVCCLTTSAKQTLMWAYYGNHRGCCIEYTVPDGAELPKKVEYSQEYLRHRDMGGERLIRSLYTKGYEWRHEKEYRAVYYRPEANPSLWRVNDNGDAFLKAEVTAVIFGLKVNFASSECQRLLKYVRDNRADIEMKQCLLSDRVYSIQWDKQFNYTYEIEES